MAAFESLLARTVQDLKRTSSIRKTSVVEQVRGPFVTIEGREVLNFCSNDYLGLAQRPELAEAALRAARTYGWGAGASRLLSGTTRWHDEVERRIAAMKRSESALLFASGYMANLGMIAAIADEDTLIFSDELNHASLIDACRLSRARVARYPHRDVPALISLVKAERASRRILLTESMFSMEGDVAPLRDLVRVALEYEIELVVDDAHGTGVLGRSGRGAAEHFDFENGLRIQSGTLSKAIGSMGGFVCGSFSLIDVLRSRARSFMFTTACPPAVCAASLAGIDILEREPQLRSKLLENVRFLSKNLRARGWSVPETPIFPLVMGSNEQALRGSRILWEKGFFVPAIRPPTVPEGQSRLRISVTALHEQSQLKALIESLDEWR